MLGPEIHKLKVDAQALAGPANAHAKSLGMERLQCSSGPEIHKLKVGAQALAGP